MRQLSQWIKAQVSISGALMFLACSLLASCTSEATRPSNTPSAQIPDRGDLKVEYLEPEEATFDEIYNILQDSEFYDDLVDELNKTFSLPRDLTVFFSDCGEMNAWYDLDEVEIVLCYELIQHYAEIFHREYQEDFADEVIYASIFTFYHELGHALVDQYQLPIVGQEEDVVDTFAAILLLEADDPDSVIAGIEQFDVDAMEEGNLDEDFPFWDEHSLSDQRFYNIACLLYGSNPDEYEDWVEDDFLPIDRAEQCEAEYEQATRSWQTLLEPYRKG